MSTYFAQVRGKCTSALIDFRMQILTGREVFIMKNEAFFMTGLEQMEKRDVPMPAPKEKQVVVKLEYVGICGSDVHYYENGRICLLYTSRCV